MTPLSLPHSYDLTIRVMKQSGSLNHYFFIIIFFKVVPPKAKLTGLCLIKKNRMCMEMEKERCIQCLLSAESSIATCTERRTQKYTDLQSRL